MFQKVGSSSDDPVERCRFQLINQQIFLCNEFTYSMTSPVVKLSIIFFYRRLFPIRKFRILTNVIMVAVIAWGIAVFLAAALQCRPLHALWDPNVNGHCFDTLKYILAVQAVNIFLDFAILVSPMPQVWTLQRPWQDKLALSIVFLMGGLWVNPFIHSGSNEHLLNYLQCMCRKHLPDCGNPVHQRFWSHLYVLSTLGLYFLSLYFLGHIICISLTRTLCRYNLPGNYMDIRGTLRWPGMWMSSHHSWSLPNAIDQKNHQPSENFKEHQLKFRRKCGFWIEYTYRKRGVLEVGRSSIFAPFRLHE